MKTRTLVTGVALSVVLGGGASAGFKQPSPVSIDSTNRSASGALGDARNSPDARQAIGCVVSYDAVNQKNNVNCVATDVNGNSAQCATQQAELIQIALGISGDSFLRFTWDHSGVCTNIEVFNSSIFLPKKP
jgi:hypothetical protein